MKFKKLASLLVVGAMVFAMAVPAFASPFGGGGTTDSGSSTTDSGSSTTDSTSTEETSTSARSRTVQFTGTTQAPTIDVDVATSMDIILNPYKLSVTPTGGEETTDQLISSTLILTNQSDCDIDIAGTITATVAGDAKLVKDSSKITAAATDTAGDKNVIIGMAMGKVGTSDATIAWASGNTAIVNDLTSQSPATATSSSSFDGFLTGTGAQSGWYLFETSGTAKNFGDTKDANTGYVAASGNTPAVNGKPYHLTKGNDEATYMAFRVFGSASQIVKEAWAATDTVSVAMTLTITPQSRTAST